MVSSSNMAIAGRIARVRAFAKLGSSCVLCSKAYAVCIHKKLYWYDYKQYDISTMDNKIRWLIHCKILTTEVTMLHSYVFGNRDLINIICSYRFTSMHKTYSYFTAGADKADFSFGGRWYGDEYANFTHNNYFKVSILIARQVLYVSGVVFTYLLTLVKRSVGVYWSLHIKS